MIRKRQCSICSSCSACTRIGLVEISKRVRKACGGSVSLVDSIFDATLPRLMDFVFGAVKRVTIAAKEVIDETAAQSKNVMLKNALATGRLNSRDIRISLQHAINFFLRDSEKEPLKSVILKHEFTSVTKRNFEPIPVDFPNQSINSAYAVDECTCLIPACVPPFELENYGQSGFRRIMREYDLTPSIIADSIMVNEFKEFSNPAKSGSLFYVTADSEFFLKTVRDYEARFFQSDLLNDYYHNLANRKRSFLARYFGLYSYLQGNSYLKLRFVIMSNIIPLTLPIHERYDLKGSTQGRKANSEEYRKPSPTLKDNDFLSLHSAGFTLPSEIFDRLKETIEGDVEILKSWNVMDYSLLMGVRNIDNPSSTISPIVSMVQALSSAAATSVFGTIPSRLAESDYCLHFDMAGKQAFSSMLDRLYSDVGVAPTFDDVDAKKYGGIPARNEAGERVIIFLGIIDILQTYDAGKQFQNYLQGFQANQCDDSTRSIIEPEKYANRFLNFLFTRVFVRGRDDLGTSRFRNLLIHDSEQSKNETFSSTSTPPNPPYPTTCPYPIPGAALPFSHNSQPPYPVECPFPSPDFSRISTLELSAQPRSFNPTSLNRYSQRFETYSTESRKLRDQYESIPRPAIPTVTTNLYGAPPKRISKYSNKSTDSDDRNNPLRRKSDRKSSNPGRSEDCQDF